MMARMDRVRAPKAGLSPSARRQSWPSSRPAGPWC